MDIKAHFDPFDVFFSAQISWFASCLWPWENESLWAVSILGVSCLQLLSSFLSLLSMYCWLSTVSLQCVLHSSWPLQPCCPRTISQIMLNFVYMLLLKKQSVPSFFLARTYFSIMPQTEGSLCRFYSFYLWVSPLKTVIYPAIRMIRWPMEISET